MTDKTMSLNVRDALRQDETARRNAETIFSGIFFGALDMNNPADKRTYENKVGNQLAANCLKEFRSKIKEDIFFDEYSLLAQIILKLDSSNGGLSKDKLLDKVRAKGKEILNESFTVVNKAINAYKEQYGTDPGDEYAMTIMADTIGRSYDRICQNIVQKEQFSEALSDYISEFKRLYLGQVTMMAGSILDKEGITIKEGDRTIYRQGVKDAMEYLAEKQSYILSMGEYGAVGGYVYDHNRLKKTKEVKNQDEELLATGLEEIDSKIGVLRRGHVWAILGPTKGGKTSCTMRLAAKALSEGKNVAIWTTDGVPEEWEAGIKVAILSNGFWSGQTVDVNRGDVMKRKIEDGSEEAKAIAAVEQALVGDVNFGTLSFITGASYVETLEKDLLEHYNLYNPYDILIIDTPLNMQSKNKNGGRAQYLAQGISTIAQITRGRLPNKVGCIMTGQIKQDVIDQLRKKGDAAELDITSGAETSEIIRTPDFVLGVYATPDEQKMKITSMHCVAVRGSEPFDKFWCRCDLGTLRYTSDSELNQAQLSRLTD